MAKNVQVRFADKSYEALKTLAQSKGVSMADILRDAVEVYAIAHNYSKGGKKLFWEDEEKGEKAELVIPGLTK